MILHCKKSDWQEVVLSSDMVLKGIRQVFSKDLLWGDLTYGYVLWQVYAAHGAALMISCLLFR